MKETKDLRGKWAAIRYYPGAKPNFDEHVPVSLVRFDKDDPEKFYWGGGSSWCVTGNSTVIVEVYEGNRPRHVEFMKKYHSIADPSGEYTQSNGWLSPDGKFYTCGHGGHDYLEEKIFAQVYDTDWYTRSLLREKAFVMIYRDGTNAYEGGPRLSPEQELAVEKMSKIGDREWRQRMKSLLRRSRSGELR